MSTYRRYFQINDAETLARISELMEADRRYRKAVEAIKVELGAESAYYYGGHQRRCAGFSFSVPPNKAHFRVIQSGIFYPKKSSKSGKMMAQRIEALSAPKPISSALEAVGIFGSGFGVFMDGLAIHHALIQGSDNAGYFADIPWRDIDPDKLDQFEDYFKWTPPASWIELKGWQVDKALDEARSEAATND